MFCVLASELSRISEAAPGAAPLFGAEERARLRAHLRPYASPDQSRAALELAGTVLTCLGLLGVYRLAPGPALCELVGVPLRPAQLVSLALLPLTYIKLFLIQHDASHGSYFAEPRLDRLTALLTGALASTTPSVWKAEHDRHHATAGDLDEPQDGETAPWTVARFDAASLPVRLVYALLTAPPVLFGLLPGLYFFVFMRVRARLLENALYGLWLAALYGLGVLGVYVVTFSVAGSFGFVVFHAQHTFGGAYRRRAPEFDAFECSMRGASQLVLPSLGPLTPLVRFALHGVGQHHLHHLNVGVPGYRLDACQAAGGELAARAPRVTLLQALGSLHYSLFDEASGRFESALGRLLRRSSAAR
jgi:omega-6 fatty acid desaturase (delta-12 desaturase)